MITPDDIRTQHLEITAKTGLTQGALNKLLRISQTHLDRVLENPIKYAKRISKLKIKGDEILKEYKANKAKESKKGYGGKNHDENDDDVTQQLKQIENRIDCFEIRMQERYEALSNRSSERDKAHFDYLASKQTEEDKSTLRTTLEKIERTYRAAITGQGSVVPIPTTQKRKSKKSKKEKSTPPDATTPGSGS